MCDVGDMGVCPPVVTFSYVGVKFQMLFESIGCSCGCGSQGMGDTGYQKRDRCRQRKDRDMCMSLLMRDGRHNNVT